MNFRAKIASSSGNYWQLVNVITYTTSRCSAADRLYDMLANLQTLRPTTALDVQLVFLPFYSDCHYNRIIAVFQPRLNYSLSCYLDRFHSL